MKYDFALLLCCLFINCMHVHIYVQSLRAKVKQTQTMEEGTAKDSTVQEGTMKDSYARCIPQRAGLDYSDDLSGKYLCILSVFYITGASPHA